MPLGLRPLWHNKAMLNRGPQWQKFQKQGQFFLHYPYHAPTHYITHHYYNNIHTILITSVSWTLINYCAHVDVRRHSWHDTHNCQLYKGWFLIRKYHASVDLRSQHKKSKRHRPTLVSCPAKTPCLLGSFIPYFHGSCYMPHIYAQVSFRKAVPVKSSHYMLI